MLVPSKILLDHALANKYCVGAYNVNNMEQIQGIMQAAKETLSPVIIQASRGALKYSKMVYLQKLMEAAAIDNPEIPIAMHLDHGNSFETVKQAIELGFTSVMIDGSLDESGKIPNTYEQNVAITKQVVEYCHPLGITVEGELGTLGGIEDGVGSGKVQLTDPDQAVKFVEETGVDSLAVAVGTSHGAYKFKVAPKLALDIVKAIHEKLPNLALVMHGSSSVPKELVDIVNQYGGQMPNAQGVPLEQIQSVIPHGVAKVNVDTDSRICMTGAVRKYLTENPGKFDPRDYLKPAREALAIMIASRMKAFSTAGHALEIKQISLEEAKKFYV
jgi:fructose-bisphosphate aldolase class II